MPASRKHAKQQYTIDGLSLRFELGGARRFTSLKAMGAYLERHPELRPAEE